MRDDIGPAALRVVRRTDSANAEIVRLDLVELPHRVIREVTAGISRVVLDVRPRPGEPVVTRSFVVKRMRAYAPEAGPERARFLPSAIPSHPNYWRREYDVYGSRVLANLPAPLRAAVCHDREIAPGSATIWLEDLAAVDGGAWTDDRAFAFARALGVWQASRSPRTSRAWFARDSLRAWAPARGGTAHAAASHDGMLDSAPARFAFGRGFGARLRAFWDERDATLDALERAPQTTAHNDLWTRNVLEPHDGSAAFVAIDWSEFGVGPLAHDLVNFVLDSVWMLDVPHARLPDFESAAVAGYAEGWRVARSRGAPRAILAAYRANARLRFGALAGLLVAQALDPVKREALEARYGRPFEEIFAARAAVVRAAFAGTPAGEMSSP